MGLSMPHRPAFLTCLKISAPGAHMRAMATATAHGHLLAGEVGELAGVSGTTIGQWARWGYIRSSQSDGDPRVYSVEDAGEARIVGELISRGVSHADVRRAISRLEDLGPWPLQEAALGTTIEGGRPCIALREPDGGIAVLTARGWQETVTPPRIREVRLRFGRRR
jgi:DNA-binding transcriptional MerR regulator